MSTTRHPNKKGTAGSTVRQKYFYLGRDAADGTHVYRTIDETIFAFDATGRIEHRFDIDDQRTVEDYISHVTATRAWDDLHYGIDAYAHAIVEAMQR